MRNRAGEYRKNLTGELAYQAYMPAPLPPSPPIELDAEGLSLLVKANRQLALLEAFATRIPNISLFISMYVRKEALMSSQIEGTQATLEDVLDPMLGENASRDVMDVVNYVRATDYAIRKREELPLCNRLIKETHAVLMQGVRGQEKNPGEFRTSQNWIGGAGSTLKTARYIPPAVPDMEEAMADLEKYFHVEDDLDVLIRAGLIHYQFETIHPFLDGNGRIGRLLITLYLMEKKMLTTPALYISYCLKQNRIEYYDRMTEVRNKGNYEQWIKFFLWAVYQAAEDATAAIDKLVALHERNMAVIGAMGRTAKTTMRVFSYLEASPIIDIQKTATALSMAYGTVAGAAGRLLQVGILTKTSGTSRNRIFAYSEYLDILRGGTQ